MTTVKTDKQGTHTTLVTNTYNNLGLLTDTTFGNGQVLEYAYDALYRLQGVKQGTSTQFSYNYDARGNVVKVTDNVNDVTTWYTYDLAGRMLNFRESTGRYVTYDYDENNQATSLKEVIDGVTYTTSFSYNKDNTLKSITTNLGSVHEFFNTEKGLPSRDLTTLPSGAKLYHHYDYNERGLLTAFEQSLETYTYSFDELANITSINSSSGAEASFTYDSLNQLLTETIIRDGVTRVIVYAYDSHGNMLHRTEGNKEILYTYNLDRLVGIEEKVDGVTTSTQSLSYDGAGNLTNDGEFTYTWQMGRQLQGISGTNLATSYKYNESGLRIKKTVNGQKHEYTYLGSSVNREVIRDSQGGILWTIHYVYAGDESPVGMSVNGVDYYFLKNAQGDISHIVNADGAEVASYEYDAWGNHLSVTGGEVAELNPYRYRGYRYDSEAGLYYLQSRYYTPEWGRFINGDAIVSGPGHLQGNNLYTYCFNNPVNKTDGSGYWPTWAKVVAGVAIVAVGAAAAIVAAPVIGTAIGVGFAAGALYSAGIVAAGLIAVACGGSIVGEALTGTNKLADTIGRANFDALTGISTLGAIHGLSTLPITSSNQRSVPNPNGRKGSPAHQAEVARQTAKFEPSQVKYEVKINTPGGIKPYRYADFSVTQNGQTWYGNVGRQLQSGLPCARERYAISDIQGAGETIRFFPYN